MSDISRLREIVDEASERREQLRDETSFEYCERIKEVGEFYREATLSEVAEEFDLSRSEARDLVVDYVKLVKYPSDQLTLASMLIGVRYYGGQYSMDEIIEEMDDSTVEDARLSIREFVGVTLSEQDQDVDLRTVSIPEDPVYPPSLTAAVSSLQNTVQQAQQQIAASFSMMPQLTSMIQNFRETFRPILQRLSELASQVREGIEYGISNFDEPSEYDPDSVRLNTLAQSAGAQYLDEALQDIDSDDEHPLEPYRDRLETGIQDFRDGRFFTPIFAFISVQDGIMHWLCEEEDVSPDYDNRFGDPVYKWDTKRDTLAELNEEWYGVSTDDFISNLESFYAHRNAIIHGDPVAFFDENIATISMLFLSMTLDTALSYSEEEDG